MAIIILILIVVFLIYIKYHFSKTSPGKRFEEKSSAPVDCSKKRVAVIGGGFTGMTTIAQLKEEGFEPVCFEKTDQPGGTWCYREESYPGLGSIMPSTVINHSKEIGAYSNFPPAKEYNNYMRHGEMYRYFMEYWTANDCLKHVRLNTEAASVRRAHDYDTTGRWTVTVRDTSSGELSSDTYDAVLVCVGHINHPKIPSFSGMASFKGSVQHTHTLKGVEKFRNQRVVVVGFGCSALDAAVEISGVAKQVYMSTKTGAVVLSRVGPGGYPMDYLLCRRYMTGCLDFLPRRFTSWRIESCFIRNFDRKLYKVDPKYPILSKDPVINDYIGSKLLSGTVIQKGDINCFTEDGILFNGDEQTTKVDSVIMATGYTWSFPFLQDDIILREEGNELNLYKCMFPAHLQHPTLAFMLFVLVWGPGFPVGEIQARWVTRVLAGKCRLPSAGEMLQDAKERYKRNAKVFAPSDKMSIRVDYVQYMDEIASLIGVKPNFFKLFLTDIRLFWKLVFGPCVPYQYRLQGPHKWAGAREAILTCEERVVYPLRGEKVNKSANGVEYKQTCKDQSRLQYKVE